jgi:hypothetical protein
MNIFFGETIRGVCKEVEKTKQRFFCRNSFLLQSNKSNKEGDQWAQEPRLSPQQIMSQVHGPKVYKHSSISVSK